MLLIPNNQTVIVILVHINKQLMLSVDNNESNVVIKMYVIKEERVRRRSGLEALRASHTALFPHIDFEGTRLTELARRLGISKQAVGQLVGELEAMGTLERVPDPSDGRAKLIRFSAQGRRGMLQGLGVLKELEVDYARDIGVERMEALRDALVALEEVLDLEERPRG